MTVTLLPLNSRSTRLSNPDGPPEIRALVDAKVLAKTGAHWLGNAVTNRSEADWRVRLNTNDYLGLARHPAIAFVKALALLEQGHGDAVSRVFLHDVEDAQRRFERRMARLISAEDSVLTMSGYNANTSIVQAFAKPGSPVYLDLRAHASLWEGVLCAQARAVPFRHNQADDLRRKLRHYGPGLVIVDSLYSTNGNLCPLEAIVDVAENGGAAIIVDETHSFGCHGPDGAGLVPALGLTDRVHFRTIGLSKGVAARGGIVAGSARNMDFFRYEARPMIFSTSVLGYEIAGFDKALDLIAEEPWRREQLHRNHARLKRRLQSLGYDVSASDRQIIAIQTGALDNTIAFRRHLDGCGVLGAVFAPPATPPDGCLIRLSLNALITDAQIEETASACESALRALDMATWPCIAGVERRSARASGPGRRP